MKYIIEGFPNEKLINFRRDGIPIIKGDYSITDIGYFPKARFHRVERKKGCTENVFILCASGKGYIQVDNITRELRKNDWYIIPSGKSHKYYSSNDEPWGLYFIHFSGDEANKLVNNGIFTNCVNLTEVQNFMISSLIINSILLLEQEQSQKTVVYLNAMIEFFLKSLIEFCQIKYVPSKKEQLLYKFLNYNEINIDKKISIYDLLDNLSVSQGTLYKIVDEEFGTTPMQYVYKMKINYAADLLLSTNMKISKVASLSGFDDQYHFSKKFKSILGYPPSEYRDKFK